MRWVVAPQEAGERLDRALARRLAIGRRRALKLLEAGLVRCNGRPLNSKAKGERLVAGDRIEVARLELLEAIVPEPTLPLVVLAESAEAIIVDKPAGMPVMPLRFQETGTVLNAAIARYPQLQGVGEGGLRSGVVHRLDTETSGALAIALTQTGWQRLRRAFRARQVTKRYLALVEGHCPPAGHCALYLQVKQHRPARVTASATPLPQSRRCTLSYRALRPLSDATFIEVKLESGFLHQIRATMAYLGHPIVGDAHYGARLAAPRPMLHAAYLALAGLHAESPLPADFQEMLAL